MHEHGRSPLATFNEIQYKAPISVPETAFSDGRVRQRVVSVVMSIDWRRQDSPMKLIVHAAQSKTLIRPFVGRVESSAS
jgi:hypothetical protein